MLVPKFQWYQDKRQLFVTFLIKNLENQTVSQDDSWLNFSAVGDVQRVVQSHHFKQESQQQLSKKAGVMDRCPWPFIFFHDPKQGMRDAPTYVVLCWMVLWRLWKYRAAMSAA